MIGFAGDLVDRVDIVNIVDRVYAVDTVYRVCRVDNTELTELTMLTELTGLTGLTVLSRLTEMTRLNFPWRSLPGVSAPNLSPPGGWPLNLLEVRIVGTKVACNIRGWKYNISQKTNLL